MPDSRPAPPDLARRLVALRYPGAVCAFVAGSIVRGEGTPTSDIDLVVVTASGDAPFRESFLAEGWPVEAFVHTRSSLDRFFAQDAARGQPSLQTMCLEGEVVLDTADVAREIRAAAAEWLERGRTPLLPQEIEDRRYTLTDALDNFRGVRRHDDGVLVAAELATMAADLHLARHQRWGGSGSWVLRALGRFDPATRDLLGAAIEAYAERGEKGPLIAVAEAVLSGAGGPLFDGYLRHAPREN